MSHTSRHTRTWTHSAGSSVDPEWTVPGSQTTLIPCFLQRQLATANWEFGGEAGSIWEDLFKVSWNMTVDVETMVQYVTIGAIV